MPAIMVGKKEIVCKLIVFDKDGTLLDQRPLFLARARSRRKAVIEHASEETAALWERIAGVDLRTGKVDQEGPLATLPRKEEMLVAALAFYLTGHAWDSSRQLTQRAYEKADSSLVPPFGSILLPHVKEKLTELRNLGFKLAVASTDRHNLIEKSFQALGVDSLFDIIVGADDVANGKPSPEMLKEIAKQTGFEPEEMIIVGDSANDMQMGKNARLKACIAVLTGSCGREKLKPLADAVINSVTALRVR